MPLGLLKQSDRFAQDSRLHYMVFLHQPDGSRCDLLAADHNGDRRRAGNRRHSADTPYRLLCGHLLLRGKHGLPDAAAGVQFVFQLQKLTIIFFRERERSCKVFHNVENGRSQPFKVLRRICRGEHQHNIARVGIFALDLCAA